MQLLKEHLCLNTMDLSTIRNRIEGMVLGHALGDALGAPHEFKPYGVYSGKLDKPIKRYSRAYGRQSSVVGQVTDDTEMAVALLHAIASNDLYSEEAAILSYMAWVNNKKDTRSAERAEGVKGNAPFTGKNTRALFQIPLKSKPKVKLYETRRKKQFSSAKKMQDAQSNGCLMRAYPLVFVRHEDVRRDVELTNPNGICVVATEIYVHAIRMALFGMSKLDIETYVDKTISKLSVEYKPLKDAWIDARENRFRDVTKSRGWVTHGFYCAFLGLLHFKDYKSAIDHIICLGPPTNSAIPLLRTKRKKDTLLVGDTDTNAAIAGALLGAKYGASSLDRDAIRTLLSADSTKGDIVRPPKYSVSNALLISSSFVTQTKR